MRRISKKKHEHFLYIMQQVKELKQERRKPSPVYMVASKLINKITQLSIR